MNAKGNPADRPATEPRPHIESCESETAVWFNDHLRCQCWCHDAEEENRRTLAAIRAGAEAAQGAALRAEGPYYTRPADPRFAELVRDTSNDPHLVAESERLLASGAAPRAEGLDVCPDCKRTAVEIGQFHIRAQVARLSRPSDERVPEEEPR